MTADRFAFGRSATAEAFGADVDMAAGPGGLCLVVGARESPAGAVAAVEGRLVTVLPEGRRVLALLSWAGLQQLQRDPAIALAGPVGIDPERFARFAALAGLDADGAPSTTAPSGAQEV